MHHFSFKIVIHSINLGIPSITMNAIFKPYCRLRDGKFESNIGQIYVKFKAN